MLGSGAMSNNIADVKNAKLILAIGTNMTEAHPVVATFVREAIDSGAKLVVIDPRTSRLAKWADMHIPIKVGADIALLNALMYVLITEDLYDKKYVEQWTDGFEELKEKVLAYPPEKVEGITGVSSEQIRELARLLAESSPSVLMYTLGITEHTSGVHNVYSCTNLQLLLGNIGVSGGGIDPLRGQNNVQGACDSGALPNVFPGYQYVTDPFVRDKFQKAWNVDSLPDKDGMRLPQMVESLKSGKIRAFYILGEDLATTEPDMKHVLDCLDSAEFLVCNEIFPTKTTQFADVIFPAAAWSEQEGTYTNTERRVQRVRKVSDAPGIAMENWKIYKEIAKRMGVEWESDSAQEIWENELAPQSPIVKGITYERIENSGLQWPVPDENHLGTEYLHKEYEVNGEKMRFKLPKAPLQAVDWKGPAEVPDEEYPFVLSTGRRLYHYNSRSQTKNAIGLETMCPEETADVSFEDAKEYGFNDGDMIQLSSRRGSIKLRARITDEVPKGLIWMAFHFYENNANWITNTALDPISDTAEYKACAVRIDYPIKD